MTNPASNAGNKESPEETLVLQGFYSGPDRDRTDDLYTASVALSQLSYGPLFFWNKDGNK